MRYLLACVILTALLCVADVVAAEDPTFFDGNDVLRGFDGVSVNVDLQWDDKTNAVLISQVETDTKLRLRELGIKLINTDSSHVGYAASVLIELKRMDLRYEDGGLAGDARHDVTISVWSHLWSFELEGYFWVPLWERNMFGVTSLTTVQTTMRKCAKDLVEQFAEAYLSVNEK